jgi:hypothetical protein
MAINQAPIVLDSCDRTVRAVTQICDALDMLESVQEQLTGANIDLAEFVEIIEAGDHICHCDAATYKNILVYFLPEVVAFLKADYSGDPTQQAWNALMKARR